MFQTFWKHKQSNEIEKHKTMITIQNIGSLPQALGHMRLEIVSETEVPAVSLSLEDVKVEERGEWKV